MTRRLWILWMFGVTALLPERAPAPSIDASHTNGGLFSLTNHTSITGNFTNFATGITQLNGWQLTPGGLNGTRNFGTIIIGGATLHNSSGPLRNQGGTVSISGGYVLGGLVTNSGYISGYGTFLAPVQNHAWFIVSGGSVTFGSTFDNFGTFIIGSGQVNYLSPWNNSQTLTLSGGTICGAPLTLLGVLEGFGTLCAPLTITPSGVVKATGSGFNFLELVDMRGGSIQGTTARNFGSITGRGTIAAELVTFASTTITASGGSLTLENLSGALNLGAVQINNGASLVVFGAWTNDAAARLDMNGGTLAGGTFTANGTVEGFGAFNVAVTIGAGETINATTSTLAFHKAVSLAGGVLDTASGGVLKNFSTIVGFGTITTTAGVGQFKNLGTVTLTGNTTFVGAPKQSGTFEVGAHRLTSLESWTNSGFLSVVGGTLTTFLQLNNDAQLRASGRIESRLVNFGSTQLTGNATVTNTVTNRGSFSTNGFTLRVTAAGNNATESFSGGGTFLVGAGTASFDGAFANHRGGAVTLTGGGLRSASSISNEGFAGDQPHISGFGLLRGETGIVNEAHATLTASGGVLRVQSATGSLSNSGAVNIASGARLDVAQPWSQFQSGSFVPSLNLSGGSLSGSTLTLGGGGTTSGGNITGFGTLFAAVDIGGNVVTASGGALSLRNGTQATTLNGGTIAGTTVRNFGSLIANGVISAGFENRIGARTRLNGDLTMSSATAPSNFGTILVGAHRLAVTANWTNNAFVDIVGGSIRTGNGTGLFTNAFVLRAGSSIDSDFTNLGAFTLSNHTSITGNFTNASTGVTTLAGFQLSAQGTLGTTNDGTILVGSGSLNNTSGGFANNATGFVLLTGGGILGGGIINAGQISGHGLIAPTVTNALGGTLTADSGALVFASSVTNNGAVRIDAPLGQIEFRANFANEGDGASGGMLGGNGTVAFAPTGGAATFSNTATQATNLGGDYDTRLLTVTAQSGTLIFEVTSTDVGKGLFAVPANGFSIGTLTLPNTLSLLRLLDQTVNQGGGTQEAIYVENLLLGDTLTAANFDFGASSLKIYYDNIIGGTGFESARIIYYNNIQPLTVVPEPSTMALLALGLILIGWRVWRRRKNGSGVA